MNSQMRWTVGAAACLAATVGIAFWLGGGHSASLIAPILVVAFGGVPALIASYSTVQRLEDAKNDAHLRGDVLGKVDGSIDELRNTVEQQLGAIEETAASLHQMTASLKQIAHSVETLAAAAEESSSSILEMAAANDEVAENMVNLAGSVQESATSIEEMTFSIKEVAKNVEALSSTAEETSSSMNEMAI
jgi:methyl-accepting chemotaxis protein